MSDISKVIITEVAKETKKETENTLNVYREQIGILLSQIIEKDNEENSIIAKIRALAVESKINYGSERDLAKVVKNLQKDSKEKDLSKKAIDCMESLNIAYKQAYKLINDFRALFFDRITYSFAWSENNEIYEVQVSEEELFPLMKIEMESRAQELDKIFKLRLSVTKEAINNFKELLKKRNIQINKITDKDASDGKISLYNFVEKTRLKMNPRVNKGQGYEGYRSLLAFPPLNSTPPKLKNKYPLPNQITEQDIIDRLNEIRGNNLSWTRGGDVGSEQDKYRNASITSSATLIKTLKEMQSALNHSESIEDMATKIAYIFNEDKITENTINNAEEKAKKNFVTTIKNIKNILVKLS